MLPSLISSDRLSFRFPPLALLRANDSVPVSSRRQKSHFISLYNFLSVYNAHLIHVFLCSSFLCLTLYEPILGVPRLILFSLSVFSPPSSAGLTFFFFIFISVAYICAAHMVIIAL